MGYFEEPWLELILLIAVIGEPRNSLLSDTRQKSRALGKHRTGLIICLTVERRKPLKAEDIRISRPETFIYMIRWS